MNWDHVESNWVQYTGVVNERWDHRIDNDLADRVQEIFGTTDGDGDAHRELSDWERRIVEIERAAH